MPRPAMSHSCTWLKAVDLLDAVFVAGAPARGLVVGRNLDHAEGQPRAGSDHPARMGRAAEDVHVIGRCGEREAARPNCVSAQHPAFGAQFHARVAARSRRGRRHFEDLQAGRSSNSRGRAVLNGHLELPGPAGAEDFDAHGRRRLPAGGHGVGRGGDGANHGVDSRRQFRSRRRLQPQASNTIQLPFVLRSAISL